MTRRSFTSLLLSLAVPSIAFRAIDRGGAQASVLVDCVVTPPLTGAWATPKPRARKIVGAASPAFQEDTWYEDCTGLAIPNGAKHFTIVSSAPSGSLTYNKGWQDFWIGGRPDRLWPVSRTDGGDALQIKLSAAPPNGLQPTDGVYAFIDFHDITRPAGSTAHTDAIQCMAGTRLTFGGCKFRNTGAPVQPLFLNDAGDAAWGGPLTDITVDSCVFEAIGYYYSIHGGDIPNCVIRNCNLGGKNVALDAATVNDPGFRFENNINGSLTVTP